MDVAPQPRYPFAFVQADALDYLAVHGHEYDAIHASPPCQDHSALRNLTGRLHGTGSLLGFTRAALTGQSAPWVIENVPGAPMRADYRLCGCMFALPGLRRERWFETSWHGFGFRSPCSHTDALVTVAGGGGETSQHERARRKRLGIPASTIADKHRAMGVDWMNRDELAQAIPPAYAEHVGAYLIAELRARGVGA